VVVTEKTLGVDIRVILRMLGGLEFWLVRFDAGGEGSMRLIRAFALFRIYRDVLSGVFAGELGGWRSWT
jgi:hypothetical protein